MHLLMKMRKERTQFIVRVIGLILQCSSIPRGTQLPLTYIKPNWRINVLISLSFDPLVPAQLMSGLTTSMDWMSLSQESWIQDSSAHAISLLLWKSYNLQPIFRKNNRTLHSKPVMEGVPGFARGCLSALRIWSPLKASYIEWSKPSGG